MNRSEPISWLSELHLKITSSECRVGGRAASLEDGLSAFGGLLNEVRQKRSGLYWVANGGSNALASHLSQDLLNKLGIRSNTFSDSALITCMANDYGYESVYLRPLTTLANAGDMLIAISSSGRSQNILACAKFAVEHNMKLVTLSGFDKDNPLYAHSADVAFYLPSKLYGQVEVGHEALLHSVIESLFLAEKT